MKTSTSASCKYFVKRKKRFCRMTVKEGFEFCGEHHPIAKSSETKLEVNNVCNKTIRVDCPYDNKHTCFANKLQKHLKVCNARPQPCETFVAKGINTGYNETLHKGGDHATSRLLSSIPIDKVKELLIKIHKIYELISMNISNLQLSHKIVQQELLKPQYGDKTKKHLIQTSAILGLLTEYNLLEENVTFVEFGAGKGQLSYWISKATETLQSCSVLLVERASLRHKMDNKLERSQFNIQRIRADIADLVLNKVENIGKHVVGVTKHLCGDATDLAMRCLRNFQQDGSDNVVKGLIMSFCCHHRCQWATYCGRDFFREQCLGQSDFDVMCGLASWAVCGSGHSRTAHAAARPLTDSVRDITLNLDREEKEEIGRRSKMILNYGRLKYIEKELNLKCNLHYYVKREISLENVCIAAVNTTNKF